LLGAIHLEARDASQALHAWQEVARLAPDGDAYWSIAKCFVAQGRFAQATVALEEAVRLQPNHTVAHRALAFLGQMRDEPDVMRRHLLQLFTLDEDMARAAQADLGL
jgi:cytochrome c-type biogenesis protein CcmH/NrfG